MSYSFTEKKRIRRVSPSVKACRSSLPAGDAVGVYMPAFGRSMYRRTSARTTACRRLSAQCPDRQPFRQCASGLCQLQPGRPAVRCQGMPAARADLCGTVAGQGPPDHHGPRSFQADRQGGQGAGVYMGELPLMTENGFVRHQRHRARDRFPAATAVGRILRT